MNVSAYQYCYYLPKALQGSNACKRTSIIVFVLNFLILSVVYFSIGCHHRPPKFNSHSELRRPLLSEYQVQKALLRVEPIESQADQSLKSVQDLIFVGLTNFRHPLGLHAVSFDKLQNRFTINMPPGLDRCEQLEFNRDFQVRLVQILDAYWKYVAAIEYEQVNKDLEQLHGELQELDKEKLNSSGLTIADRNRTKLKQFEQAILSNSRFSPEHSVGDKDNRYRELSLLLGCDFDCKVADVPQSFFEYLEFVNCCLCCSNRSTLSLNPELLLQRGNYLSKYYSASSSNLSRHAHFNERSSDQSIPEVPNTWYDLAFQHQEKIRLETHSLWARIQVGRDTLKLINDELNLLLESDLAMERAISEQIATRNQQIQLRIQIDETRLRAIDLSQQLLIAIDLFLYQAGVLCEAFKIERPNFWIEAKMD